MRWEYTFFLPGAMRHCLGWLVQICSRSLCSGVMMKCTVCNQRLPASSIHDSPNFYCPRTEIHIRFDLIRCPESPNCDPTECTLYCIALQCTCHQELSRSSKSNHQILQVCAGHSREEIGILPDNTLPVYNGGPSDNSSSSKDPLRIRWYTGNQS